MSIKILLIIMTLMNLLLLVGDHYGILTFILLSLPTFFLRQTTLRFTKRNRYLIGIFTSLYFGINILSFIFNPPVRFTYYIIVSLIKLVMYLGYFILLISMQRSDWIYKDTKLYDRHKANKYTAYLCLILSLIFLPFFIAFSPGNMFIDSYSQWGQAMGGIPLSDWHPVFSTLLLRISYYLVESPILYTLGQVVTTIGILTYFSHLLGKYGIKRWIISIVIFSMLLMTVTIPNMVTIYKDNIYNLALFLFTLYIFEIVKSKGHWFTENWFNGIMLFLTTVVVMLSRHNGLYVAIFALAIFIIFGKGFRKPFIILTIPVLMAYWVYSTPLMNHYDVEPGSPSEKYSILLQHIGGTIANDGEISHENQAYLAEILPLDIWKEKYTPSMIDPVKFHADYNKEVINDDQLQFLKVWWDIFTDNPLTALKAHLQQVRPLWDINGWEHGLPGSVMFHYFINSPKSYYDDYVENYTFPLGGLRAQFEDISFEENHYDLETKPFITTLSAISIFSIFSVVIYLFIKKRWQMVLVLIPAILHIGTLAIAMPAYNMRYVLGIILIGFFSIPLAVLSHKSIQR